MTRKHLAFLIVYGPEVRAFIHSGLIKHLSEQFDVSIITTQPTSAAFADVNYASIHPMPMVNEHLWLARLRRWSLKSQRAWLHKKNFKTWRHLISTNTNRHLPIHKQIWQMVIDHPIWFNVFPTLERGFAQIVGSQRDWHKLFNDQGINCLVAATLKGEHILPALQTARSMDQKVIGVIQSWKDVFVSSYISVVPDHTVMPTQESRDYMLAVNPHVSANTISISSSLGFEKVLKPDCILSRKEFCQLVDLDEQRPYICYTAGSPLAVSGELAVIHALLTILADAPNPPQLLLRINPMDNGSQFSALQAKFSDILFLQKPTWEWRSDENWVCPLADDVTRWINTIYHSICNVSIPSTVTLEYAALKKPVINICFDLVTDVTENSSIARFWNAPFYEAVRRSGYMIPTFSTDDLSAALQRIIDKTYDLPETTLFPTQSPVYHMQKQIESVLRN